MNNNLNVNFTESGHLITDDEELNQIIKAVEDESGSKLAMAIPAISFDDDPDFKIYLLLLTLYPEDRDHDSIKHWVVKTGRQVTYDYLKNLIKDEVIDPNESFVIAGNEDNDMNKNNAIFNSKSITVFRFMKVMFENHKILDDGEDFDINEFDPCDWEIGDKTILEV